MTFTLKVYDSSAYIQDEDGKPVAFLNTSYRTREQVERGARLLAAAPQLLEALRNTEARILGNGTMQVPEYVVKLLDSLADLLEDID